MYKIFFISILSILMGILFANKFGANLVFGNTPSQKKEIEISIQEKKGVADRCEANTNFAFCLESALQDDSDDATNCDFLKEELNEIAKSDKKENKAYYVPKIRKNEAYSYQQAMKQIFQSNLESSEMIPYAMKTIRHYRRNLMQICNDCDSTPYCNICSKDKTNTEFGSTDQEEWAKQTTQGRNYCMDLVKKYGEDIAMLDFERLLSSEIEEKEIDFITEKYMNMHKNAKKMNEYLYFYLMKFDDFNKFKKNE